MASTTTRIGLNAKMYRNSGSYASPTWGEVSNVRDVGVAAEMVEGDGSIRGHGGIESVEPTLLKIPLEFQMNYDPDDAEWEALRAAFFGRTSLEMLVLDRATGTGAEGFRMTMKVLKFAKGEPLQGVQTTDVMMKPAISANAPAWYTGA